MTEARFTQVLPTRPMLREEARPVPGTADHLGTAGVLLGTHLVVRPDGPDHPLALLPESRPGVRTRDAQLPYLLVSGAGQANAPISQVETEQVCVVRLWFRKFWAGRTP